MFAALLIGIAMLAAIDVAYAHGPGEEGASSLGAAATGESTGESGLFVSEQFSRRMAGIRDLMDKNKNKQAIARLEDMDTRSKSYNRYENAILHQTLGYAYAMSNDYAKAIAAFEEVLSYKALPQDATFAVMQNLGQLYIATEKYDKGIAMLEDWIAHARPQAISPQMRVLLGNAYFHQRDYGKAAAQVKQAIAGVQHPDKSWFQLLAGIDQQSGRLAEQVSALKQAIDAYPAENAFWQQLAGAYRQMHDDKRAAAVIALACNAGLCDGKEKRFLAEIYLYIGAPVKSARLIEAALKDGSLTGEAGDWMLLASSWQQARELDKAESAYVEAAKRSKSSGAADFALGQINLQRQKWQAAADAFARALEKGKLSSRGRAHLLLGITQYYLGHRAEAQKSLETSLNYPDVEKEARHWLKLMRSAA